MGKVKEFEMQIAEIKKCGEMLNGISEELKNLFSSSEPEEKITKETPQKEKPVSLEDVRAVMADKSRKGYTSEVKALLTKRGVNKL